MVSLPAAVTAATALCPAPVTIKLVKMDQQKQIRKWLISELGMSSSERIFSAQEKIFHECVSSLTGKTPNQMKTLTGTILPRVALYKALRVRRPSAPAATAAISTSSASPDKENSEKIVKK